MADTDPVTVPKALKAGVLEKVHVPSARVGHVARPGAFMTVCGRVIARHGRIRNGTCSACIAYWYADRGGIRTANYVNN